MLDLPFENTSYSVDLEELKSNNDVIPSKTSLQKLGHQSDQEKGRRWLGKKVLEIVENNKFVIGGVFKILCHGSVFRFASALSGSGSLALRMGTQNMPVGV